jgi:hypothetical protein
MGEDGDHGTSSCQRTPAVGPIFTGGRAAASTPALFTPRNCGQCEADDSFAVTVEKTPMSNAAKMAGVGWIMGDE